MAEKARIEIEVEYVRTEKVTFDADLGEGFSDVHAPSQATGRLLRQLTFWMHHGKSLALGEKPRLLGWRVIDPERICPNCDQEVSWGEGMSLHRAKCVVQGRNKERD